MLAVLGALVANGLITFCNLSPLFLWVIRE